MPIPELNLKKSSGTPNMEVVVGNAHFGGYKVKLYDRNDRNGKLIAEGVSDDPIVDRFEIGTPTQVNGRILAWKIVIHDSTPNTQDDYSATVIFRQKDKPVAGGVFTYGGALDTVKVIGGFVRVRVA